jgi:type I restriction enzyme R subunit
MIAAAERQLEEQLIDKLGDLKYEIRADIRDRAALKKNFRQKFETLNRVSLTDGEFERLLDEIITADVFAAAKSLRATETFVRDDGTPLNYTLVNTKDWCKNTFEVVNQLRINTQNSHHRYDVILLINGIPTVQIELKTLSITPRRAVEQIVEYKNDRGNGYTNSLMCFVQLFIVSNQSDTWYFANNNPRHFSFNAGEQFLPVYQFAAEDNRKITHLDDFAEAFLAKCTLGNMISRYMVLVESEQKMLMMRPYQIYAVKAIVECIHQNCGNGYIWHTTGSGKTLTSFKASTLLKDNPDVEKVLFVVDRKDLDRQTREEFNKFQDGCVEENTNTASLVRRLLSDNRADKVIVTTIQKLGLALDENSKRNQQKTKQGKATYKEQLKPLQDKRMVFIFDECHRSQFGENHKSIKTFFPKSQLFGFTGTPIFEDNATQKQIEGKVQTLKTTEDLFQRELHAYTITHAIEDKNVLRFRVDYFKPEADGRKPTGDSESPRAKPDGSRHTANISKQAVVEAILAKHDAATDGRRFNAVLATASINDAIEYFELFQSLQRNGASRPVSPTNPNFAPLKIACVFSPPAEGNKDVKQLQEDLPQEKADNAKDPEKKKAALKAIIADYNAQYSTNHSISEFDLYYQDVQTRIKDQKYPNADLPHKGKEKIDVTIVVDMLLTGFDSKYLNTLYVDKNLKHHGLIQAFSRTNRVLNGNKPFGNILDFRQQQESVDTAIKLFSGAKADSAREIWLVDKAPVIIDQLEAAVRDLDTFMKSQGLECKPEDVSNLKGDDARLQFTKQFKEVRRLKNQLEQYTDLSAEHQQAIEAILPKDQANAFQGMYLVTAERLKALQDKGGGSVSPEVQQADFEFVLFASSLIDYDYIMGLISRYSQQAPGTQKMTREELIGLIQSDAKFMDEREEITDFVSSLEEGKGLSEDAIRDGYQKFKAQKNAKELATIAMAFGLTTESLQSFVEEILIRKIFDSEKLTDLMEPLDLGWKERSGKEEALMNELVPLLKKRADGREISGLSAYE